MLETIEFSDAIKGLASANKLDSFAGLLNGAAAQASAADVATVVAGVIKGTAAGGAGFEIEIPNSSYCLMGYFVNNQHTSDYDQIYFRTDTFGTIISQKSIMVNYLSLADGKLCVYRKSVGGNLFVKNNTAASESIRYRLEII